MKYTSEVFQRLSRGQFIPGNSVDPETRAIYNDVEENEQQYRDYFSQIDFQLCSGNGYYYFSRREPRSTTENKLAALMAWIDYVDFLTSYDAAFDAGTQFTTAQVEVRVKGDVELRNKLDAIIPDKVSLQEKIAEVVRKLADTGFAELVNEVEGMYQVTAAYRYITSIIECLNIDEEVRDSLEQDMDE